MKSKIEAYLSYVFSRIYQNFKDDISLRNLIKECKSISKELVGYDNFSILDENGIQISDGDSFFTGFKK